MSQELKSRKPNFSTDETLLLAKLNQDSELTLADTKSDRFSRKHGFTRDRENNLMKITQQLNEKFKQNRYVRFIS